MRLSLLALALVALGCATAVTAQDACFLSGPAPGVCTLSRYAQCFRRSTPLEVTAQSSTPVATGVTLVEGTDVVLVVEGSVSWSVLLYSNPDGDMILDSTCDSNLCPLQGGPRGLLYRIGETGSWQVAGSSIRVHDGTLKEAQQLYLIYNDGFRLDNSGKFNVDIQVCDEEVRPVPAGFALTTAWNIVSTPVYKSVPANQGGEGTYSGVRLDGNTEVTLSASGVIQYRLPSCPVCLASPRGGYFTPTICSQASCALQGAQVGALLYRFGLDGPWQVAGASKLIRGTGTKKQDLYFIVNDMSTSYNSAENYNSGSYSVYLNNLRERCPQDKC